MTTQTINFELVSPEEKLVSEPVTLAVLPGAEGEIGVGAGHSSLVITLQSGVVQLFKGDNPVGSEAAEKIFIAGGFADITGEQCVVLAEQAVNINDIDQAATTQKISDLNEDLALAEEMHDQNRIRKDIVLYKVKLSAATGSLVL